MKKKTNLILWVALAVVIVIILGPKFLILAQKSQTAVTQGYYIEQSILRFLIGFLCGVFATALQETLQLEQFIKKKRLREFLSIFVMSFFMFIAVHLILMVVSTLALSLAGWISNPLFHSQHTFGSMLWYSFLAWMVGFWVGYGIQSIPRIHKYMESLNQTPQKQKESLTPAVEKADRPFRHVDDLQAIKEYCSAEALEWWKTNELESATCDKCNGPVSRNSGYIIGSWLYCGHCEDMFSEQYRYHLIRDPNFYGRGVLEKARKRLLES